MPNVINATINTWGDTLRFSFQNLWLKSISILPEIVLSIVIFIVGWVVGDTLGHWVAKIFRSLKVDQALESIGLSDIVRRTGYRLNSGEFIGALVKWFVIVVFLISVLDILNLKNINVILATLILPYIVVVIASVIILMIGALLASVLQKIVVASSRAANLVQADLFGAITKWSIWIFTILVVIDILGIGGDYLKILFIGLIAMLTIAGGLAFGLGGQQVASEWLEKVKDEISAKK